MTLLLPTIDSISGVYPEKEYVLQYRESDSNFVQRMLAEHGMWYYFEHTERKPYHGDC